ncbi:ABC transporter ATP-binding protein/permease [Nesterenkonia ebinurensis]|uniref:ABC transporter ATP-binding protein/permease n=1 Tax=Nesterenkonia ebinurensis TaxID=2608252 RepID=UPI00123D02A5|nr:ABC transporter ATP-binding protein/permease [Nesterenkonia ebinurensis]
MLILDESVSQLDVTNGAELTSAFDIGDQTTVIIARRLSTLLHTPRILVMEHGHLVGDGSHAQLLQDCAAYRSLLPGIGGWRAFRSITVRPPQAAPLTL